MAILLAPGMRKVRLGDVWKLKLGELKMMQIPDTEDELLLLKESTGHVLAIDNRCPHKRAKLSKGDIEDLGEHLGGLCVRCPKHRRKYAGGLYFSFSDGRCRTKTPINEKGRDQQVKKWFVRTYQTRVNEQGIVHVQVPIPELSSSSESSSSSSDKDCREVMVAKETRQRSDDPKWFEAVLVDILPRSDSAGDVFVFSFQLNSATSKDVFLASSAASKATGTSWHIWLKLADVEREYTPIGDLKEIALTGTFSLLIRLYIDGEMSAQLRSARVGAAAFISLPVTTLEPSMWPMAMQLLKSELWQQVAAGNLKLGMVCAGTGITPCAQALELVVMALEGCEGSGIGTHVTGLLTSNRRIAGPLMLAELASLERRAPEGSITVRHTLTDDPQTVAVKRFRGARAEASPVVSNGFFQGRISIAMLEATLPASAIASEQGSKPCLVVVTGPPGLAEHCLPLLEALGHPKELIVALDA